MAIGEFDLIDKYFAAIGIEKNTTDNSANGIALGIGDDAALLDVPTGQQLAISVDTLIAGVHFPVDGDARLIAHKALRTNLSDLAAMSATPLAFTLALTLPAVDESWLAQFSQGLKEIAAEFKLALIGGDTTRGTQLVITIQILGTLPSGTALKRSGAQCDDIIFVTGTLGDARAALDILNVPHAELTTHQQFFMSRYYTPTSRLTFSQALRGIANSAIDISDGLAADLGHILKSSKVGAELELAALPLSTALRDSPQASSYALSGGDDYELCFTAPRIHEEKLRALASQFATPITAIGYITNGKKLIVRDINREPIMLPSTGYTHF